MKPQFSWDGQNLGPRVVRMPQALGALALALFQVGAPAWLTNGLVGLAGFLGTGLGQLALAAGALGLQFAFQKKPGTPQPSDVQSNIRQEISARRRIYARYLTGSVIIFGFRRGEKTYVLHYICEGPIKQYVSFRLDKKPVTLDGSGFVTEAQYQVKGRSRVQILTTLGTMTDGPFAEILAAFPELNDPLKPFRHRGCAMALEIIEQVPAEKLQDVYPNNLPSLQFLIDAYDEVYDPRTGTVGFSDNAGCILLTEIMDVYGLAPGDEDDINFASFADFADHCDEDVPLKAGGSEKRYRAAGVLLMDAENEARVQSVASVCNAEVYMDPQGRIAVRRKMRQTPGIALRAKNGDHLSVQMEGGRGLQKQFNLAKVSYVDPTLNYKANEVRWQDDALLAEDGMEYPQPFVATLCPSATQGMRIGKLSVAEGNPAFVGSLTAGPQALDLMEDYAFTLDLAPEDAFEAVACATGLIEYDSETMTVSTGFVVYRDGVDDWDPAVDEQDQVIVPPELPSYVDDILLDVTVTVQLLSNSAPVLAFAWTAAGAGTLPDSYSHQVEVSPAGADEWSSAAVTQESDTAKFAPVADGGAYDWRIRNIASGKTFDWQYSAVPVTVVVDSVAPVALSSFTQTAAAPHLGNAVFSVTTPNDAHIKSVKFYRKATGAPLNVAVDTPFATLPVASSISAVYGGITDGDPTRANLIANGDFASDTVWSKGTGWTISGGKANKAAGTQTGLSQAFSFVAGAVYRLSSTVSAYTAGTGRLRFTGTTTVNGVARTANGTYLEKMTAAAGNNTFLLLGDATFACSYDDIIMFPETVSCAPQGTWDYYAVPFNGSSIPGPASGPVTVTII